MQAKDTISTLMLRGKFERKEEKDGVEAYMERRKERAMDSLKIAELENAKKEADKQTAEIDEEIRRIKGESPPKERTFVETKSGDLKDIGEGKPNIVRLGEGGGVQVSLDLTKLLEARPGSSAEDILKIMREAHNFSRDLIKEKEGGGGTACPLPEETKSYLIIDPLEENPEKKVRSVKPGEPIIITESRNKDIDVIALANALKTDPNVIIGIADRLADRMRPPVASPATNQVWGPREAIEFLKDAKETFGGFGGGMGVRIGDGSISLEDFEKISQLILTGKGIEAKTELAKSIRQVGPMFLRMLPSMISSAGKTWREMHGVPPSGEQSPPGEQSPLPREYYFDCPECKSRHQVTKGAEEFTCPKCNNTWGLE